jgi:hypothetical protein
MIQPALSGKSPATQFTVTVLLIVAIVGTLWVPIYARATPKLGPFPFFYWYQLIWVPVSSVLCWICYLLLKAPRPAGQYERVAGQNEGARR